MPIYEFKCSDCEHEYEELCKYDKTGKYKNIACPLCQSKKKSTLITGCKFAFGDPVGTDRWTSEANGHDYRFHYNLPNVLEERKKAESKSHMGADPYKNSDSDLNLGEGIHDMHEKPGLS